MYETNVLITGETTEPLRGHGDEKKMRLGKNIF